MADSQVGRTSSRDSVTKGADGRGPGAPWSSQREPLYDALAADVAASVRHARQDAAWLAMADSQVWRTSSRDLDIVPPAEALEARGAAARPRPPPVGQRSGGGQQAVTTLRTRPQDGCGRCVQRHCRRPLSGDLSDTSCTPSEENASATSRCYAIKGTLLQPSCVHARHCASSGGAMRGHNGR